MFLDNKISNIEEIQKLLFYKNVILFLDTNIVIGLCHLWCNPEKYKNTDDSKELINFIKFRIQNSIDFFPLTGIWESTRLINDKNIREKNKVLWKK